MGGCLNCGHEYERHLFGGMCFYCDCKRAVYETETPFGLVSREAKKNGRTPAAKRKTQKDAPKRLGAK